MKRNSKKFLRSKLGRRGATAVEFVLVAPAFMYMLAVCGEFARLSMMRNLSQNAAYEAARLCMTEGAKVADGTARAQSILSRVGTRGAVITIKGSNGTAGNVQNEIDFNTKVITCSIDIPLGKNSLVVPSFVMSNTKIHSTMTVRAERYQGFFNAGAAN